VDIECLTIMDVLSAVDQTGMKEEKLASSLEIEALEESLNAFESAARSSRGERKLKDI
jgi:membrane protein